MLLSQPANQVEQMSKKEWLEICEGLEPYHAVFYKMWHLGKPVFTNEIPTACVQFDKVGQCITWKFNPNFWNDCSFYKKMFVICHEALHILLNHGQRFNKPELAEIANVAMDVAVNHSLVSRFGFVREQISEHEQLCWVDTVFPNEKYKGFPVPDDQCSEFYLNLLRKKKPQSKNNNGTPSNNNGTPSPSQGKGTPSPESSQGSKQKGKSQPYKTLDSHTFSDQGDDFSNIIKKLDQELSNDEKKELRNFLDKQVDDEYGRKAGTSPSSLIYVIPDEILKTKKKEKWETVIKKWTVKALSNLDYETEQWARIHRRNSELDRNLFLPSELDDEDCKLEKKKIKLHFYLDVSGSCYHLKDRFFKAAMSLNPKYFDINLNVFNTDVFHVDIKNPEACPVGGGTAFDIIEDDIQRHMRETESKYPDAVWIVTDGGGTDVNPEKPERWYWFLSEDYTHHIPKKSPKFMLEDYE
jgi:hypothetical protein